jgi:hypothetical protein
MSTAYYQAGMNKPVPAPDHRPTPVLIVNDDRHVATLRPTMPQTALVAFLTVVAAVHLVTCAVFLYATWRVYQAVAVMADALDQISKSWGN